MANSVSDFFRRLFRRPGGHPASRPSADSAPDAPAQPSPAALSSEAALEAFLARLKPKVYAYLENRHDCQEQKDHLTHLAGRTRWLYANELRRQASAAEVTVSARDDAMIEVSVFSHDMGKWIPRDELRALFSDKQEALEPVFRELRFSPDQTELFLLGIRRRFHLPHDGHTPEYDAAHHLVSAYILIRDPGLEFHTLPRADQTQLINMVVGHQFGSYFKGSLLNLSLHDREVTTGMLIDSARSDRLLGDTLSSVFHDADISDLLFVGSLEKLANGEEKFHGGGLVKILMINFTNFLNRAPQAPADVEECLFSCQTTVNNACKEFLTPVAIEYGQVWREQARRFLELLASPATLAEINRALSLEGKPVADRLAALRTLIYTRAKNFLKELDGN